MTFEWFVGLFEGEGCISQSTKYPHLFTLEIAMTDKDVLERIPVVVGGRVIGPRIYKNPNWKHQWMWRITTVKEGIPLLHRMLPLLGERRAEKARVCIAAHEHWHATRLRGPGSRGGPGSRLARRHADAVSPQPTM